MPDIWGDDISEADGVFGKKTEAAVRQFQKDHGIDVTGIVCPNTQNALDDEWEDSMEPQNGEEMSLRCHAVIGYEGRILDIMICDRHMSLYGKDGVDMESATVGMLQAAIVL